MQLSDNLCSFVALIHISAQM